MSRSRGLILAITIVFVSCSAADDSIETTTTTSEGGATTSTTGVLGPAVLSVSQVSDATTTYDMYEFVVEIDATYDNPFDQREVTLDARFTGPNQTTLDVPGFWDGENAWKLRFTPSLAGDWSYSIVVGDERGESAPQFGEFSVGPSAHPGFLRIGAQVDPDYSPRYFAYENGTPWYGRGHADLDMSLGGADPSGDGLRKFTEMTESGENYEMWWPMWGNNYIQGTYDDYSPAQMNVIDYVVRDAEAKGVALVYTIWGHQFLRTPSHDWPDERWTFNGFSELTDISGFFVDPEAWAWQENYYRYIIARWSHSPAIVMWQTVTEINGTESYDQTDPWHERVNAYFQENDPYRHPTTATKSGARDWPEGHAVMDVPQVHIYHVFGENPIADTVHFVEWTRLMWDREEKPNWAGEYGNRVQDFYPEFMHNANWSSLAAGAALTPTEWNDGNAFGTFDDEMVADMKRFADFVDEVPMVSYDPDPIDIASSDGEVRAWGLAGESGGVIWAQDFALENGTIDDIRADETVRSGISLSVSGITGGDWRVEPYDTWSGEWLESYPVVCSDDPCEVPLPGFSRDLALHLTR